MGGCQSKKAAVPTASAAPPKKPANPSHGNSRVKKTPSSTSSLNGDQRDYVYKLLVKAPKQEGATKSILEAISPVTAAYQNSNTKSTPLHMAIRLLDAPIRCQSNLEAIVHKLLEACPDTVYAQDASGKIPLHYAIAPSTHFAEEQAYHDAPAVWRLRCRIVNLLFRADARGLSTAYLHRNDVAYESGDATGQCSPLYRALQTLPDDFEVTSSTVDFMRILTKASTTPDHSMVGVGNLADGDKPLALLYRRFTRQFDLAEKFFSGDNSRPEVVDHRRRYKTAAGNTWKIIELLLKQTDSSEQKYRTVHRAVQVETPPDLLRYIVETNAEDLTITDELGNLPLHYAAMSKPPATRDYKMSFPAFYSKYVIDELLYKFPEAAAKPDAQGRFPLTLAIKSGKQWIGGGIKSLYDAYPDALKQINIEEHPSLKKILESETNNSDTTNEEDAGAKEEKDSGIVRDEHHDAIMLVQSEEADVSEVVTSMWAHEEDAGVQMLGCVALSKMILKAPDENDVLRIALSAVPGVVNAMKAHPNEVIVQEKACHALAGLAPADGQREVSFVASGAVAAIVGAMQAHVSDPGVQEYACEALSQIIKYGGSDRATIVASVSGLTAIVNSLAAHAASPAVQREGCTALVELTAHAAEANLPDLSRTQTEPLLQAAKQNFPEECGTQVDILLARLV